MTNPIERYANVGEPRNAQGEFFGIYPGRVEYVNDPSQCGKIKVRIPGVTGFATSFPTDLLPWASPCFPFGGGQEYGSIMIPPVGSSVWVLFIGGDPYQPVWIGTFPGIPVKPQKMLRDEKGDWPKGPVSMSPSTTDTWWAAPGPTAPTEFLEQVNHRPETYIPFKTPKGAAVIIEDRDDVEKLSVIDRSGQGLFLESPVKADYNKGNALQRLHTNASMGTGLPVEATLANESTVSLVDLGGQSIELHTQKNSNRIKIISKENKEETEGSLKVTYGGNKEVGNNSQVILDLAGSDNKINLEIIKDNVTTAQVTIDGLTGMVEIYSQAAVKINTENLTLNADVEILGNLVVENNTTVLGDVLVCGALTATEDKAKTSITQIDQPSI